VNTGDGHKFVGLLIPTSSVRDLTTILRRAEEQEVAAEKIKVEQGLVASMKNEGAEDYFCEVDERVSD
jgi:hypothetical protein